MRKIYFLKKAALIFVAFFILSIETIALEESIESIRIAENLLIKKERKKAIQVLIKEIRKQKGKEKKLLHFLNKVTTLFYFDKTQKEYELANSLRLSKPQMAIAKYNEAHKSEKHNITILMDLSRTLIMSEQCSESFKVAQKAKELNPFSKDVYLLITQISFCLGQNQRTQELMQKEILKSPDVFTEALQAEQQVRSGEKEQAAKIIEKIKKKDKYFAYTYYLEWKNKSFFWKKAGEKYVDMCKSLSDEAKVKYFKEPRNCLYVSDVEASLTK